MKCKESKNYIILYRNTTLVLYKGDLSRKKQTKKKAPHIYSCKKFLCAVQNISDTLFTVYIAANDPLMMLTPNRKNFKKIQWARGECKKYQNKGICRSYAAYNNISQNPAPVSKPATSLLNSTKITNWEHHLSNKDQLENEITKFILGIRQVNTNKKYALSSLITIGRQQNIRKASCKDEEGNLPKDTASVSIVKNYYITAMHVNIN
ncbi:hypothetical protein C2G38_2155958 [Gigaspora rosea]|uniref:Uncharacterized protein n=1 Tax=Gigaspora rosea TaxID=44941 RepID=A0A397W7D1_9GLOM|nr:hypothetical protein C2G38_2155958 [Gigaspora rosea]